MSCAQQLLDLRRCPRCRRIRCRCKPWQPSPMPQGITRREAEPRAEWGDPDVPEGFRLGGCQDGVLDLVEDSGLPLTQPG